MTKGTVPIGQILNTVHSLNQAKSGERARRGIPTVGACEAGSFRNTVFSVFIGIAKLKCLPIFIV